MKKRKNLVVLLVLKIACVILTAVSVITLTVSWSLSLYVDRRIEKSIDENIFDLLGVGSEATFYFYERDSENGLIVEKELGESLYGGYRYLHADFDSMPKDLINAFVSIEDKDFYNHNGVDWGRTLSAGANFFLNFNDSFGGSTITQQLIKNVTDKDEYSFQRKIQEIFWALDLETKMTKNEIMEMYLNIINLSQGCYGVGAAAKYYFSKDISELNLNECACIAAITNSPSYYDPIRNPENNKKRKDLIIEQMYRQGYIDESAYLQNKGFDVILNVSQGEDPNKINSWYIDMVVEDVIQDLMKEYGYSRETANMVVYTGGLKVYTAVDPDIQKTLEKYYSKESNFGSGADLENKLQSSMIIIDNNSGDILGVAGAIGEKNANRVQNFATQTLRPAGSVIKPLSVYAPALEKGIIKWSSVYDDVPVSFGKVGSNNYTAWPKNSNGEYRGLTNINYAISNSVNTVTVKVLEDLGVEQSFDFLYNDLDIKSLIKSGVDNTGMGITDMDIASLALGQQNYGVTVREITAAYSVFSNNGVYNSCKSYYKVTDGNGNIILEKGYKGKAVLSEENAAIMGKMLENVVKNGTANNVTLKDRVSCAGKTGTTQNNYDRWFIGYTPQYTAGVWYGYEYPKSLSGANICINTWDNVMTEIYNIKSFSSNTAFEYSPNIVEAEYCADSGRLMTEACKKDPRGSRKEIGWFIKGTEPTEYCDCHVLVAYDIESGGVSLENMCKYGMVEYVGMITANRSFPTQIYVTDAQYVYKKIGEDILPESSPELPFFNNMINKGEYCGLSKTTEQFNRLCRAHFNYFEWLEKKENIE
ncbi:MAG: transglycosylase [Ruminococcaceae bacterium]|nr:transglycosylase [Oscillospiraceae bacterium]